MKPGKSAKYYFFLIMAILIASPASALETLRFKDDVNPYLKKQISAFLKYDLARLSDQESQNLAVAQADLNGDGIYELVVKTPLCLESGFCTYKILAETKTRLTELASFSARNIAVGNNFSNGVRNLLVFNSPINDFSYSVYIWDPQSARYMIKSDGR